MWFFMYACYILSAFTFLFLVTAFLQAFAQFTVFNAGHVTFIILTSIVYIFTETLIIFFFVGTGVSVKEYTIEHNLDHKFHKESIAIKRRVYPPLMLNLLYMIILFILVGAVDTLIFPKWLYQIIFALCIFHYVKIKIIQNGCFKDNTNIILEMSGLA